jgi:hypothetical protein
MLGGEETSGQRTARNDGETVSRRDEPFTSGGDVDSMNSVRRDPGAAQEVNTPTIRRKQGRRHRGERVLGTIRRGTSDQSPSVGSIGVRDPEFGGLLVAKRCRNEVFRRWPNERNASISGSRESTLRQLNRCRTPTCCEAEDENANESCHVDRVATIVNSRASRYDSDLNDRDTPLSVLTPNNNIASGTAQGPAALLDH